MQKTTLKESWRAIREIACFDFRQGMKNYRRVFIGTAAAIFLAGFLAFGFKSLFESGLVMDPFAIAIVNQEKSSYMDFIFEQVQKDRELSRYVTLIFYEDGAAAKAAVEQEKVMAAITIPRRFLDDLLGGRQTDLQIYATGNKPVQTYMMTGIINSYFKMFVAANYSMNTARKYYRGTADTSAKLERKTNFFILDSMNLMKSVRQDLVRVSSLRGEDSAGIVKYFGEMETQTGIKGQALLVASVAEYYVVVVVLLFILFISIAQAGGMIAERKSGLTTRIIITGAGKGVYLTGKFIGGFFLTFGQSAILLFLALLFFMQDNATALPMIMLIFLALIFMVNAVSFLLAVLFDDLEHFTVVGNLLVFIMASVGGGLVPILYLPDSIYYFAWLTPHYWGIEGVVNAIAGKSGGAMLDFGILFGLGALCTGATAVVVRLKRGYDR